MTTQQHSHIIITLCQSPNTALQAIHLIIANHGASEAAFRAVYDRVMEDKDVDGAYYLAVFAQTIDDLPFDGTPLIEMVMAGNDNVMKSALIEKLPRQIQAIYSNRL